MEENYETVRKYVERLEAISVENGNILTGKTGRFSFIGDWLYQGLGGIQADPNAPGFKNVIIKPDPVGDVSWVKAHHDSPYGRISSQWEREGKTFTLKVTIPPNSTGTIYVPAASQSTVLINGEPVDKNSFIGFIKQEQGRAVFNVDSGTYTFAVKMDK